MTPKLRVSTLTSDFIHPSPYQVWFKYVKGTQLETRIGPWRFALFLHSQAIIELFYYKQSIKENLKCKLHSPELIPDALKYLETSPLLRPLSWVSRLAQRIMSSQRPTND